MDSDNKDQPRHSTPGKIKVTFNPQRMAFFQQLERNIQKQNISSQQRQSLQPTFKSYSEIEKAKSIHSQQSRKSVDYQSVIEEVYNKKYKSGEEILDVGSMDKDTLLKKLTERSHSDDSESETSQEREERIAKLDKELLQGQEGEDHKVEQGSQRAVAPETKESKIAVMSDQENEQKRNETQCSSVPEEPQLEDLKGFIDIVAPPQETGQAQKMEQKPATNKEAQNSEEKKKVIQEPKKRASIPPQASSVLEQNVMQKYFTENEISRSQTQNFDKPGTSPFKSMNTYSDSNFGFASPSGFQPKISELDSSANPQIIEIKQTSSEQFTGLGNIDQMSKAEIQIKGNQSRTSFKDEESSFNPNLSTPGFGGVTKQQSLRVEISKKTLQFGSQERKYSTDQALQYEVESPAVFPHAQTLGQKRQSIKLLSTFSHSNTFEQNIKREDTEILNVQPGAPQVYPVTEKVQTETEGVQIETEKVQNEFEKVQAETQKVEPEKKSYVQSSTVIQDNIMREYFEVTPEQRKSLQEGIDIHPVSRQQILKQGTTQPSEQSKIEEFNKEEMVKAGDLESLNDLLEEGEQAAEMRDQELKQDEEQKKEEVQDIEDQNQRKESVNENVQVDDENQGVVLMSLAAQEQNVEAKEEQKENLEIQNPREAQVSFQLVKEEKGHDQRVHPPSPFKRHDSLRTFSESLTEEEQQKIPSALQRSAFNKSYTSFTRDNQRKDESLRIESERKLHDPHMSSPFSPADLEESKQIEALQSHVTPEFNDPAGIGNRNILIGLSPDEQNVKPTEEGDEMDRQNTYKSEKAKLITQVDAKDFQTDQEKVQRLVDVGINWLIKKEPPVLFGAVLKIQRFWKKMRRVLRSFRRRQYIVQELLQTEHNYVKNLEYLIKAQTFLTKNAQSAQNPILAPKDIEVLFSNVKTLRQFNNKFCTELEQRVGNWSHEQKIGDVFIKYAPFFRLYNEYCSNYEKAEQIYESQQKNTLFTNYLEHLVNIPESKGLSLNSFLIMPVQRPVKYPLLLRDLLNHTRINHPDYTDIKRALAAMKEINNAVNADLKRRISEQKKIDLQNQFKDKVQIVSPTRYYVGEEKLTLIEAGWSKEILIIMFNDLLLLLSNDGDTYVGQVELNSSSFVKQSNDFKYFQNILMVTGGTRSYRFSAQTYNSKMEVLETLKDLIGKLKQSEESRVSAIRTSHINELPSRKTTLRSGREPSRIDSHQVLGADLQGESSNPFLPESPLIVDIVGTEWRFTHTVYIIEITRGEHKSRIFKRYSEFSKLHKTLQTKRPHLKLPQMPKKRWLTFKTKVIEERKLLLEKFLQEIVLYKIFQNDTDLMQFLEVTDWAIEFSFDGEGPRESNPTDRWTGSSKTADIQIHFCNMSQQRFTVPLDAKAIEVTYHIAQQNGISNFKDWGLFIIEPFQDEKLIDPFDKPFDNMKRAKGFIESAISKFSQKNKIYCQFDDSLGFFLKIKNATIVFKRNKFRREFYRNEFDFSSLDYKEIDLLYHQCLAAIATNQISLRTYDLIDFSARYLLITYGIKTASRRVVKDEILKIVSKKMKMSKVAGFWEDRIMEKWGELSNQDVKMEGQDKRFGLQDEKILFVRSLRNKNFFGASFYWVEPYTLKEEEAKMLMPYFWLVMNHQQIYFIHATTYMIIKQFDVPNISLQIFPTALIINVYKQSLALRTSSQAERQEPIYSIRVNTPRGYEIQNQIEQFQAEYDSRGF